MIYRDKCWSKAIPILTEIFPRIIQLPESENSGERSERLAWLTSTIMANVVGYSLDQGFFFSFLMHGKFHITDTIIHRK